MSGQVTRLLAILRMASAAEPVTQLAAGQQLGITGTDDTIRRRVQHLRDEIVAATGKLVCSTWSHPAGMWLPACEEEEDDYIGRVLGRAYKTLSTFRGLEREKRLRIVEQVQRELGLGDEEVLPAQMRPCISSAVCACGCGRRFTPTRIWHRFFNSAHRRFHEKHARSAGLCAVEQEGATP